MIIFLGINDMKEFVVAFARAFILEDFVHTFVHAAVMTVHISMPQSQMDYLYKNKNKKKQSHFVISLYKI